MAMSDELQKLAELHQRGALSDEEFARAKTRLLGEAQTPRPDPALSAVNAFRRSRSDRWVGGVCGGLAQLSGLAAWVWRLAFALLALCAGGGVLIYLLLWIFVPQDEAPFDGQQGRAQAG